MSSVTMQRDLVITHKRETLLNVGILSKLKPMSSDLSRLLKENNLEKPTQNVFNHLTQYLVGIIDPQVSLPWPLYDTKTERIYRNELSLLISDYSSKGMLAPVMSSYLINPGSYKVILLMFQLSQLAVQRLLLTKIDKDRQKKLYNEMTNKYKLQKEEGFIESIEKETQVMLNKFSTYLRKKAVMEEIAKKLRDGIMRMENLLNTSKAQELIDNLVDEYLKKHTLDEEEKEEILEIKNVHKPSKLFDKWLLSLDKQIDEMESNWDSKMLPFLDLCQSTYENTSTLIARQTGEVDKRTYTIEYNPKTDDICTDELQKQVNSQQKYILKNIVREDKLNFPNLIRGFLISICFILKNAEIGDEIYQFNEYLEGGCKNYSEIVSAMRILVERVMNAEGRLQPPQDTLSSFASAQDMSEIPPLPDLSDIKMNRDFHHQVLYDAFTPLNLIKHQFNLRKQKTGSFMKPLPKTVLITPFHHAPRDDFLKSIIACRVSAYDKMNVTQNCNVTIMSQINRGNETIAECTSGFTKQQICRLLSTKKSSSSKKFKHKTQRPDIKIVKGGLFNESTVSNESIGLLRSHSSPNLLESRDKRSKVTLRSRKLSIMKEDSPSLLGVSGIAALERDTVSIPSIIVTPSSELSSDGIDLNNIIFKEPLVRPQRKSKEMFDQQVMKRKSTEFEELLGILPNGKGIVQKRRSKEITDEPLRVLPQRKSNEIFEEQKVISQQTSKEFEKDITGLKRKSEELFKETEKVLLQRRSNEELEEDIVLPQRKLKEVFEQPQSKIPQRITKKILDRQQMVLSHCKELFVEPQTMLPQRKSNDMLGEEVVFLQRKSRETFEEPPVLPQRKSKEICEKEDKTETPKNSLQIVKKTSSLEKIINRFKKVRASILPTEAREDHTIFEEKENLNTVNYDVFTANRNLLPDLLSPSCSIITSKSNDLLDQLYLDSDEDKSRKPRESLGTALGVDHTFLDQYDLID